LGPTRGEVAGVSCSPLFWNLWGGTPPTTPRHGDYVPLDPRFPPSWALGSPGFWVPLMAGLQRLTTRPFFFYFGGTSPKPPGMGLRPLHPCFNQGRRRPTFFKEADFSRRKGHTPGPPPWGLRPPGPPFAHPRWLRVCQRFVLLRGGEPRQIFPEACAPLDPPYFSHPRGLRVCQSFGPNRGGGRGPAFFQNCLHHPVKGA